MNTVRIPFVLFVELSADLRRKHPFAYERVGFLLTRRMPSSIGEVLLATEWLAIPDDGYIEDREVGARISRNSIREVLRRCLEDEVGALHVHAHDHFGRPSPSHTDEHTFRQLTPSLCGAAPSQRSGSIIFSSDDADARLLLGDAARLRVTVVGRPLHLWSRP